MGPITSHNINNKTYNNNNDNNRVSLGGKIWKCITYPFQWTARRIASIWRSCFGHNNLQNTQPINNNVSIIEPSKHESLSNSSSSSTLSKTTESSSTSSNSSSESSSSSLKSAIEKIEIEATKTLFNIEQPQSTNSAKSDPLFNGEYFEIDVTYFNCTQKFKIEKNATDEDILNFIFGESGCNIKAGFVTASLTQRVNNHDKFVRKLSDNRPILLDTRFDTNDELKIIAKFKKENSFQNIIRKTVCPDFCAK